MFYRIREKIAYSRAGKLAATIIRNRYFPNARVHWVQQALAECSLRVLCFIFYPCFALISFDYSGGEMIGVQPGVGLF